MHALADAVMLWIFVWAALGTDLFDDPLPDDPALRQFVECGRLIVVLGAFITLAIFSPLLAFAS